MNDGRSSFYSVSGNYSVLRLIGFWGQGQIDKYFCHADVRNHVFIRHGRTNSVQAYVSKPVCDNCCCMFLLKASCCWRSLPRMPVSRLGAATRAFAAVLLQLARRCLGPLLDATPQKRIDRKPLNSKAPGCR